MKKSTKGIILAIFFGTIMVTSVAAGVLLYRTPTDLPNNMSITGTPADNFPDAERAQFCGTGNAKSNTYITEYKIPTECTMPLAIVTDPQGNVWFTQTNTGKVAMFDPYTETFTEYTNPDWPPGGRSMMWGIDYSPDGSLLFTDEANDFVWRFSISDEKYDRFSFPSEGNSLPQRLKVVGSQIIINDFLGNKITFFDAAQSDKELTYLSLPSPFENSVTSDFTIDNNNNLWYTNWIFQQHGFLVKYDQNGYANSLLDEENIQPLSAFLEEFELPPGLNTPNGAVADSSGKIWLADTSSNFFFSFEPENETFTQYVTSLPTISTYGNSSGLIKTPITRPYWIELDQNERVVFNEQTANRIGIFEPKTNSLIEYLIPSKNPNWADCEQIDDCGLAQVFGFTIHDEKIWFTEWVENNIGVLDTSIPLPFEMDLENDSLVLKKGEQTQINVSFVTNSSNLQTITLVSTSTAVFDDLSVMSSVETIQLDSNESISIPIQISANENALSGTYKVLIGGKTDDVTISKYLTLTVES